MIIQVKPCKNSLQRRRQGMDTCLPAWDRHLYLKSLGCLVFLEVEGGRLGIALPRKCKDKAGRSNQPKSKPSARTDPKLPQFLEALQKGKGPWALTLKLAMRVATGALHRKHVNPKPQDGPHGAETGGFPGLGRCSFSQGILELELVFCLAQAVWPL